MIILFVGTNFTTKKIVINKSMQPIEREKTKSIKRIKIQKIYETNEYKT